MFTGIIQGIGKIEKISQNTKNRSAFQMTVDLGKHAKGLKVGQSVALNGVCLSATKISKNKCNFEMIDETIKQTDLGNLVPGAKVNIERSLKVGDRMEGHFVLGHVDGVGTIKKIEKKPKEIKVWFEVTKNNASVCLIPHTIKITNFQSKKVGDKINIETDILGKYILKRT